MAYDFGASKNNRLTLAASVLTASAPRPLSVGFRIKQASTNARIAGCSQWIFENNQGDGNPNFAVSIQGGATNTLAIYTNGVFSLSSTWTATTSWHSLLLTYATGTPGATAFYRNGAAIGTGTATFGGNNIEALSTIGGLGGSAADGGTGSLPINQTLDGDYYTTFDIDGALGEFCIWNVVLDASEGVAFTAGASGLLIRPSALRCCMPFNNGAVQDLYRGAVWTAQGTNTKQADHPRILLPQGPILYAPRPAAAAPSADTSYPPYPPVSPAVMHMLMR